LKADASIFPFFTWFDSAFQRQAGRVLEFVKTFFNRSTQTALSVRPSIRYTHYVWSLNDQSTQR
jgi:hypothetical protein